MIYSTVHESSANVKIKFKICDFSSEEILSEFCLSNLKLNLSVISAEEHSLEQQRLKVALIRSSLIRT